jgi:hypothetical protein
MFSVFIDFAIFVTKNFDPFFVFFPHRQQLSTTSSDELYAGYPFSEDVDNCPPDGALRALISQFTERKVHHHKSCFKGPFFHEAFETLRRSMPADGIASTGGSKDVSRFAA